MAKLRRTGIFGGLGLCRDAQDLFGGVVDHVDGSVAADGHPHQCSGSAGIEVIDDLAIQIEGKDATGCVVGHVDAVIIKRETTWCIEPTVPLAMSVLRLEPLKIR